MTRETKAMIGELVSALEEAGEVTVIIKCRKPRATDTAPASSAEGGKLSDLAKAKAKRALREKGFRVV